MERRKLVRLMAGTAAIALVPGLAGCVAHHDVHRPAPQPVYRPPEYYNYYYYPQLAVYYHVHTRYYWYFSHGAWRRSRRLPGHIRLGGPRHTVVIRDDNPYERHRDHNRRYGAPRQGHGPDDKWYYTQDRRSRGVDGDERGNGQDRHLGSDPNNNRVIRRNGGQNNIRRQSDGDRNNSPNLDRNQNPNQIPKLQQGQIRDQPQPAQQLRRPQPAPQARVQPQPAQKPQLPPQNSGQGQVKPASNQASGGGNRKPEPQQQTQQPRQKPQPQPQPENNGKGPKDKKILIKKPDQVDQ